MILSYQELDNMQFICVDLRHYGRVDGLPILLRVAHVLQVKLTNRHLAKTSKVIAAQEALLMGELLSCKVITKQIRHFWFRTPWVCLELSLSVFFFCISMMLLNFHGTFSLETDGVEDWQISQAGTSLVNAYWTDGICFLFGSLFPGSKANRIEQQLGSGIQVLICRRPVFWHLRHFLMIFFLWMIQMYPTYRTMLHRFITLRSELVVICRPNWIPIGSDRGNGLRLQDVQGMTA